MMRRLSHRRWPRYLSTAALAGLDLACTARADAPASSEGVRGRWLTENRNLEIEIAPCSAALCGTVVRVLSDHSMRDPNLPMKPVDPRPVLGMVVLDDFLPDGDHAWNGKFYNRENGKTFRCVLTRLSPTQLSVRAYVGIPLLPQTQVWQRLSKATATDR